MMKIFPSMRLALVACGVVFLASTAQAQFVSGTIFGTGLGSSPGGRDVNWNIAAVPAS